MIDWHEPDRTVREMLLTEPGSRVDGPTEDVLRVMFTALVDLYAETMPEDTADALALRSLPRLHGALADRGYVVRDYARE